MRKKLLSIILCLVMALSVLPLTGSTAYADVIGFFGIEGLLVPIDGMTYEGPTTISLFPNWNRSKEIKATATWTKNGGSFTTFRTGETYFLNIESEEFTLEDDLDGDIRLYADMDLESVSVSYFKKFNIDSCYTVKKTIPYVEVSYNQPVVGKKIKKPWVASTAPYVIKSYEWYRTDESSFDLLKSEDIEAGAYTFEAGKAYTLANVMLEPKEGYCFDVLHATYKKNGKYYYDKKSSYIKVDYLLTTESAIFNGWTQVEADSVFFSTDDLIKYLTDQFHQEVLYIYRQGGEAEYYDSQPVVYKSVH